MLHPGLVVVGVSLGSHLEVERAEGSLGEDGVVPDLIAPFESLSELLGGSIEDLLGVLLQRSGILGISKMRQG